MGKFSRFSPATDHWEPHVLDPKPDVHETIYFPRSDTQWHVGPVLSEQRYHEYDVSLMSEGRVTCSAIQIEGPLVGTEAILRVWEEIPKRDDSPMSVGSDVLSETRLPGALGPLALAELVNLKRLTKLGSTCTTRLIDYILRRQKEGEGVKGGYKLYMLVEKLPGSDLSYFHELSNSERDEARAAFGRCLSEFYALGFQHQQPHRRHIMWAPWQGRCYITHLEHAFYYGDNHRMHFEFQPKLDYSQWMLGEREGSVDSGSFDGIDPVMLSVEDTGHTQAYGTGVVTPFMGFRYDSPWSE
ncbi:hypothetical protein VTO42DRAFT_9066 [Malbranchea cinnamomea]